MERGLRTKQNKDDEQRSRGLWAKQVKEDEHRLRGLKLRLREARKEAKLSQTEAAYILGSNQTFISRMERLPQKKQRKEVGVIDTDSKGEELSGSIDFLTLERLAAIYGKPIEYFKTPRFFEDWAHRNKNEPLMYGKPDRHSLEEWKYHFRERRWPVDRGKSQFANEMKRAMNK